MPDISTTYLGMRLRNPLVASASPLVKSIDAAKQIQDAGAAAIVMYSLFEEQIIRDSIDLDYFMEHGAHSFAESLTYFPDLQNYNIGPEPYLQHVERLKHALDIPVIGSLNGATGGGWIQYAKWIEEAGADALEINIYNVAGDPFRSAADVERQYIELVQSVCAAVSIPVAVKLSPFYTSLGNFIHHLKQSGAKGAVLFNRFYQPDFDIEEMEVKSKIDLSVSSEMRLPLRWIAILSQQISVDFALTGGAHTAQDVIKGLMAGAKVVMMTSALLKNGPPHITATISSLLDWMTDHEYVSVEQMCGCMSQSSVADPSAFERAHYVSMLSSWSQRKSEKHKAPRGD